MDCMKVLCNVRPPHTKGGGACNPQTQNADKLRTAQRSARQLLYATTSKVKRASWILFICYLLVCLASSRTASCINKCIGRSVCAYVVCGFSAHNQRRLWALWARRTRSGSMLPATCCIGACIDINFCCVLQFVSCCF